VPSTSKKWLLRSGLAVLTTASASLLASPAQAATTGVATVSGNQVSFSAAANRVNSVNITRSGRVVTIDDRVTVRAGKGCKAVKGDKTKVRCTTPKTPTWVRVSLGNLNDVVVNRTDTRMAVWAGTGDDRIWGGSGADILWGQSGNDRILGGKGNDTIGDVMGDTDSSTGNDLIWGQDGNDQINGGSGNDGIDGGPGDDYMFGGPGSDAVYGQDGHDTVMGHDYFSGGADTNDRLYGGNGDDSMGGYTGNDILDAGAGDDMAYGGDGTDTISGGPGADELSGGLGNDRVDGGTGGDEFREWEYRKGWTDADLLIGSGADWVTYRDRTQPITADADGVTGDDGQAGEGDTITTGFSAFTGGKANDHLYAPDHGAWLEGGPGDDVLLGSPAQDRIDGGPGDDHIDAKAGNDILTGDNDNSSAETLVIGADVIIGGDGRDRVEFDTYDRPITVDLDGEQGDDGAAGEGDTLGADIEDVFGTPFADRITGNDSDNEIKGGYAGTGGGDKIYGLGGDDRLDGGYGGSFLYGGPGDDILWGHIDGHPPMYLDGGEDDDRCLVGKADPDPDVYIGCETVL
jgi:Ca2+-binding RTX toxin-like protein